MPISIDPAELGELVRGSKAIYEALGGDKEILAEEQPTIDFAYACVVAIRDIAEGEPLTMDNVWVKRPGTGEIRRGGLREGARASARAERSRRTRQLAWSDVR